MKIWAVLLSPTAGSMFVCFCRFIFKYVEFKYLFADLLTIWWLAIFAQLIVELILVGAKTTKRLNLKDYCWAAIYSTIFLTFVYGVGEESFEIASRVFLTLMGYSVINVLTYNEVYFSELTK